MLTELTVKVCVYAVPRTMCPGSLPGPGRTARELSRWEGVGLSSRTDGFRQRRE